MKINKWVVSYMLYAALGIATAIVGITPYDLVWWVIIIIFIAAETNAERK